MSYNLVASGPERRFEITGGLVEGYTSTSGAATHTIDDVIVAHHEWQHTRNLRLGVVIVPATISYGWPVAGRTCVASESSFALSGVLSVEYMRDVPDEAARGYIEDLASLLAERLGQQRIYYTFDGVASILERDGAILPHVTASPAPP